MSETIKLPEFEITIKGSARFELDKQNGTAVLITRISAQPWIPHYSLDNTTQVPSEITKRLFASPELLDRIRILLASALAPVHHRPVLDPIPIPLIDALPEQLLHAAGMAVPMMLTAVCNYLGLPLVDLKKEIDAHARTLRRALKTNLGVPEPGHSRETKKEFLAQMKKAAFRILPSLGGKALRQVHLAGELGWEPSYLRVRLRTHGIKNHKELLRLLHIEQSVRRRG